MRRIFRRGLQTAQSVHSIHYIKKVPFEKNCNFELLPSRLKINIISISYKRTLPMKECDEKSKKELILAFELVVHVTALEWASTDGVPVSGAGSTSKSILSIYLKREMIFLPISFFMDQLKICYLWNHHREFWTTRLLNQPSS